MNLNLNINKKFEEYLYDKGPALDGAQYIFKFPNLYGASVIKHSGSYGHLDDLWELAVIIFTDGDWDLTYNTDITDDVEGHLTDEAVNALLERIMNLNEFGKETEDETE